MCVYEHNLVKYSIMLHKKICDMFVSVQEHFVWDISWVDHQLLMSGSAN